MWGLPRQRHGILGNCERRLSGRLRQRGFATLEYVIVMLPLVMVLLVVVTIAIWVFVIDEAQGAVAEAAVIGAQAPVTGDSSDVQQAYQPASSVTVSLPAPGGGGPDADAAQWASDILAPSLGWYQQPTLTMMRNISPGAVAGYAVGFYSVTFKGSLSPFWLPAWLPTLQVTASAMQPFRVPGPLAAG